MDKRLTYIKPKPKPERLTYIRPKPVYVGPTSPRRKTTGSASAGTRPSMYDLDKKTKETLQNLRGSIPGRRK